MKKKAILISIDALGQNILKDPRIKAPWIRYIMKEGARVDMLNTVYPSVTWAVHSSVVTGMHPSGHGIFGNRVYDRKAGCTVKYFDPEYCRQSELFQATSLSQLMVDKGLECDAVCWPLTQGDPYVRHNIPEFYQQEHFDKYSSPEIWASLKDAGFPVERYAAWSSNHSLGPMQDSLTADICSWIITNGMPDLLLTHFLLIDSFLHDFGTGTPEVRWAVEYIDQLIGQLMKMIGTMGLSQSVNVIIFSDHGQSDVRLELETDFFLKAARLNRWKGVSNGGSVFFYYNPQEQDSGAVPEFQKMQLTEALRSHEWFENLVWREDFSSIQMPAIPDFRGYLPDGIMELKTGFSAGNNPDAVEILHTPSSLAMHGYRGDHPDMQGIFCAIGPDFKTRAVKDCAHVIDIAPTVASIFDLNQMNWDGTAINELLVMESQSHKYGKLFIKKETHEVKDYV